MSRRYLMLHLPRWATDCLKRADPALAASTRPLVLWEKQKGAMRIVALDRAASAAGLSVGQSLSDARAMVPDIEAREIDHGYLEAVFADFADWHSNASPLVAVLTDDAPYGDLCLDITGVTHLFGGEAAMLQLLTERLEGWRFSVRSAVGPTIGAVWALAHFSVQRLVEGNDIEAALADLPVASLRLDEAQTGTLKQLGLKRVGQLYHRDRGELQARFGRSFLLRLDQALGDVEEKLTPRLPIVERYVERRFVEPIGLIDDVLMTARDLSFQLASRLEMEGLGAQTFHLFLYRVDHKVMVFSVNAARATRDAIHIARLFAHRADRLSGDYDAGFGIDMIRLAAGSTEAIPQTQIGVFEIADGAEDLDQLYDRIASRLGPFAMVRSKYFNTHIPERVVRLEPTVARTPDDPQAQPLKQLKRPLRLLPAPEPINVSLAEVPDGPPPGMVWRRVTYRFIKSSGPERIGVEWWMLPRAFAEPRLKDPPAQSATEAKPVPLLIDDGPALTRDYYVAEDDGGRRFWLFREGLYEQGITQRWYLHGIFG